MLCAGLRRKLRGLFGVGMLKARLSLTLGLIALLAAPVSALEYWPAPTNLDEWAQTTSRLMRRIKLPTSEAMQVAPGTYSAIVALTVRPDGTLEEVAIRESSGHASLDDAILQQVRKLPFPPFADDMGQDERRFNQPINLVLTAPKEKAE